MATTSCPFCGAAVAHEASFCMHCGEATPTAVNAKTGEISRPGPVDMAEEEFRQRLQGALGEGYELRALIGRGGFGAVYVAWDKRLEREVAVKVVRPDVLPTPQLVDRFQREARAVAQIRHPNIVPVYSVGEGEGLAYFVMPRIEGESLSSRLKRVRSLPVADACRIAADAADALAAAHRRGIVHRDVKPENIMLEGEDNRVLLMDFGIAKAAAAGGTRLTDTGVVVGTPRYMSPEQASGETELDYRSDIYSLGVVAYELLAGRPPFTADTVQRLLIEHLTADPPSLRSLVPDLPEAVEGAVMRCLAKAPQERWSSVADFGQALRAAAPVPASARPAPRGNARPLDIGRRELTALGISALLSLGIGVSTLEYHSPLALEAPTITRQEAGSLGEGFLVERGAAGAFDRMVAYEIDSITFMLVSDLGLDPARRLVTEEIGVGWWSILWIDPEDPERRWRVEVDGFGRIRGFARPPPDSPEQSVPADTARVLAERFLNALGWQPGDWTFAGAGTGAAARTGDHMFSWTRLPNREGARSDSVEPVSVRMEVEVTGSVVTAFVHQLDLGRDRFRQNENVQVSAMVPLFLGVFAVGIVGLWITVRRRREIEWSEPGLLTAAFVALSLVLLLTLWPAARFELVGDPVLFVGFIVLVPAFVITGAVMFLGVTAAALVGARRSEPRLLAGLGTVTRTGGGAPLTWQLVGAGYAIGAIMLGLIAPIGPTLDRALADGRSLGETGLLTLNASPLTGFAVLAAALAALVFTVGLLFVVTLVKRFTRSTALAVAVPIIAGFLIAAPSLSEWNAVGDALGTGFAAVVLLRYGVVSLWLAFYASAAVSQYLTLVRLPDTDAVLTTVLIGGFTLVPAAVWFAAQRRKARPG